MDFLSNRPVSLSRHIQGCLASAAIAATIVTSIYAALFLIQAKGIGTEGIGFELARAWLSTATWCLVVTGVVFSLMRLLLNGFRANLGMLYIAVATGITGWVLRSTAPGESGGKDQFFVGAAICIGLMIALGYWRVATRGTLAAPTVTLPVSEPEDAQPTDEAEPAIAAG